MADIPPLSIHRPTGDPRGGVVVIQEAFGVNSHIEDICARLAGVGWVAVAPHLFHRTGDPMFGYDDFSQVLPHVGALASDGILGDVDAAIAHLEGAGIGADRQGVVGFCLGGNIALNVAVARRVGAAVTFYGRGIREGRFGFPPMAEAAPRLAAPWLGLYGDLDESIPVDEVDELRDAAAASGQPTEVVRYPGAGHGFYCDRRASFHPPSAADAWARTLGWFDRHLTP